LSGSIFLPKGCSVMWRTNPKYMPCSHSEPAGEDERAGNVEHVGGADPAWPPLPPPGHGCRTRYLGT
jgi:hypothetical protein